MMSPLNDYRQDEPQGKLSLEEARQRALKRLKEILYGPAGKDYFWVKDFGPEWLCIRER